LSVLPLLAVGCSSETVGPPPAAPINWQSLKEPSAVDAGTEVTTAKERALPSRYVSALGSPGLGELAPLLDEDVHLASPGLGDANGRAAVVRVHDALFGAFDDRKIALRRVWRTPNEQTIEWTMTGAQTRDFMGIPSTRKEVAFKGLTLLWTKDDGSITEVHLYVDTAVVKAQLGTGPKELIALPPPALGSEPAQIFEEPKTGAEDEKHNAAVVQSALDALENNSESGYIGAMTDDVELNTLERARPTIGRQEARLYYKAMHKAIGQLDTTTENAWAVGRFAVVEYWIAGEQLGPIGWIPVQPDKVIRLEIVDVAEIREGKIARVWRYDNPAEIATVRDPIEPERARTSVH
jgi:ketosteroid isomerase-like protein